MNYKKQYKMGVFIVFTIMLLVSQVTFADITLDAELSENFRKTQVFYVSDFDLDNPENNPVLFNITIRNDATPRKVKLQIQVASGQYGSLLKNPATTKIIDVSANEFIIITNLNLGKDRFSFSPGPETNPEATQLQDAILKSGKLLADTYNFTFDLVDENGNSILKGGAVRKSISISNPSTLELSDPEGVINSQYPQFTWQSDMKDFTIVIYEWLPEHSSAQDVVNSTPRLEKHTGNQTFFTYPSSGVRPLEFGKTYVWLVKAKITTSGNPVYVTSSIKTFQLSDPSSQTVNQELVDALRNMLGGSFDAIMNQLQGFKPNDKIKLNGKTITVRELKELAEKILNGDIKVTEVTVQ
jgi:hypothetical protein